MAHFGTFLADVVAQPPAYFMEECRMHRARHWGIVSAMAISQVGVVIVYHGLLSSSAGPVAAAQTVVAAAAESAHAQATATPAPAPNIRAAQAPEPFPAANATAAPAQGSTPPLPAAPSAPAVLPLIAVPAVPHEKPTGPTLAPPPPAFVDGLPAQSGIVLASGKTPANAELPQSPPLQQQVGIDPIAPLAHPKVDVGVAPGSPTKLTCPWDLTVKIVDGRSQLTVADGRAVKLTIVCDKLDVKAPAGAIQAAGQVVVQSEGLSGICDALSISWQEAAVQLVNARLSCQMDGRDVVLQGPVMQVQLTRPDENRKPTVDEMLPIRKR
jgi:hypothetical protein